MAAGVQTPLLWKLEQTCMWHSIPETSQRDLPPSPETWGPMGSPGISRPLQAVRKIAAPTAPLGKGRNLNLKVGQDLSDVVMFFCLSLSTFSRSRELPSTCFELYSGSRFNRGRRLSPILFLCRSAAPGCVSSRFRTLQAFLPDVQAAWFPPHLLCSEAALCALEVIQAACDFSAKVSKAQFQDVNVQAAKMRA